MPTDTMKWIEINWKVLDTINDDRSTIGYKIKTQIGSKHYQNNLIQLNFNRNNLCRQIQLNGLRYTKKFSIQLMTTDQLFGLQRCIITTQ